ncbi:hypothetical protein ACFX5U_20945 [Sphingobacterium sp. SG20118]|uniref:hypothetical protein n=1 Tax=Sphingobacterium sp. SG20118 TaxID=3367156 RepID=UPI0037DFC5C7
MLKELDQVEFDYLFVIKGYKMPVEFLDLFRKKYPKAVMIMHQWDSERNNPFSHLLAKFDKVFSFDPVDLKKYPQLEYLPNFYLEDIYTGSKCAIQYDILFLASYLPERLQILSTLNDFASKNRLKLKAILIMPFTTYFKELIKGNYIDLSFIKFSPLCRSEYLKLFWASKIIFDMGSKTQTGMSQRTIETIECGKKLLTNNTYIKDEEIFNEDQVFIVSDALSSEIISFVEKPFIPRNTGYSLQSWISRIFR